MEAIRSGDGERAQQLANRHMINAYENIVENGFMEQYEE